MTIAPNHDPAEFIKNADEVCSLYGSWPTFHDAEVLTVALERGAPPKIPPSMVIRVWTTSYNDRAVQSIVRSRFDRPEELAIEGFNHQNVLFEINFKLVENMVHVTFEGIYGVHATFRCQKVTVEAVEVA